MQDQPWHLARDYCCPRLVEKILWKSSHLREIESVDWYAKGLRRRGVGNGTPRKEMEGPKLDQLEESQLAPEDNHWKSIVNRDSKSATGKDAGRIGTECRFWSRVAKVPLRISWHSWQLEGESRVDGLMEPFLYLCLTVSRRRPPLPTSLKIRLQSSSRPKGRNIKIVSRLLRRCSKNCFLNGAVRRWDAIPAITATLTAKMSIFQYPLPKAYSGQERSIKEPIIVP